MPEFCSDPLWNTNLTWFSLRPDFTLCFHETALVYIPCAILWLLAPLQVYLGHWSSTRNVPWSPRTAARFGFMAALVVLSVADLVLELVFGLKGEDVTVAPVLAPVFWVGTSSVHLNFEFVAVTLFYSL